jgi:hypothetical protein
MSKKGMLVAAAVAGLFAAAPVMVGVAHAGDGVMCKGINSCKGKGECKSSAGTSCKGQNGCKGQGVNKAASEKECKDKGGTVVK